ncbi:MAG: YeeE/YedE family protein [Proteobacteria bacterium]|nr:YeeE/YedE family protein [Pseudomonadota bacterium]
MEWNVHLQMLTAVFAIAAVMGALVSKTNFCTMGAVSDWVNMEDTGRLRSWLLAIGLAVGGLLLMEMLGTVQIPDNTFPPYRTANFAWLRYLLGGAMFGVGMTLASGCGNKTLVRIGGGNLKSLVVLAIACGMAYLMLWTDFYATAFDSWMSPLSLNLNKFGIKNQELGSMLGGILGMQDTTGLHRILAAAISLGLIAFAFSSKDFRGNADLILGGLAVGLAVVAGWYATGGSMGQGWREFAEMADTPPSRVQVQSLTFISPMGDLVHYLVDGRDAALINFGIMALLGVIVGAFAYAVVARQFKFEWFPDLRDFAFHAAGGVLMGVGGVLSMGCTIGQGVTGFSTLAVGSMLTFAAIIAGAAGTMKLQYRFM